MDLLSHQAEFINSNHVHTALVGGYRSGKSQCGTLKTVLKKLAYPGVDVAYYLPTYRLMKDVAFGKIAQHLTNLKIPYILNASDYNFITKYGKIICRSMENPDSIIGYEVGYSCADEIDTLRQKHANHFFDRAIARLSVPLPNDVPNSFDFVTTPEGYGFMYDFFVKKKI